MGARRNRLGALMLPMAATLLACLLGGCSRGGSTPSGPSTAADEIIAASNEDEERKGLTQARDDIDAEMRDVAAAKDAEIEMLRRENEALRKRLKK